jgi:hypothetical protein
MIPSNGMLVQHHSSGGEATRYQSGLPQHNITSKSREHMQKTLRNTDEAARPHDAEKRPVHEGHNRAKRFVQEWTFISMNRHHSSATTLQESCAPAGCTSPRPTVKIDFYPYPTRRGISFP